MHKYKLIYKIVANKEGIDPDQIPKNYGACDAIVMHLLTFPADGSYSFIMETVDGRRGGKLDPAEQWKAWAMMAKLLSEADGLSEGKQTIAKAVWATVVAAMASTEAVN